MPRHTSLLTLLLSLIFLGSLPLATVARDDRRNDDEQKRWTKPAPRDSRTTRKTYTTRMPKDTDRAKRDDGREPDRSTRPAPRQPNQRTPSRTTPKPIPHTSHDRYYRTYRRLDRRDYRYYYTYRYHTYYLAPIVHVFHPIGFSLTIMPRGYVRIVIGGLPYFYYEGVYYRHINRAYVVVHAPIGIGVPVLPTGFIVFSLGAFTYYYVNETYYLWNEDQEAYVVVKKPAGSDEAIAKQTAGRLYVYPKKGQSEKQQAKDRYACHRWAVKETGVDPTESDAPLSVAKNNNYKRAITACLEGRGYTVK